MSLAGSPMVKAAGACAKVSYHVAIVEMIRVHLFEWRQYCASPRSHRGGYSVLPAAWFPLAN